MARPWNKNQKRDYEHLEQNRRKAERERQKRKPEAAQTGEPETLLEELGRRELYEQAQEMDIRGRSRMTKEELRAVLRAKG